MKLRKAAARGLLLSFLLIGPLLPRAALHAPARAIAIAALYALPAYLLKSELYSQLRWMKRLSNDGPVPALARAVHRRLAGLARALLGERLDAEPLAPLAVGALKRSVRHDSATLRLLPAPRSSLSREAYDVEMKARSASAWRPLATTYTDVQLDVGGLDANCAFEVRVRATNSRGVSAWREGEFRTKQRAVDGGGTGPGYSWRQPAPFAELSIHVPLPAGVRAKELSVATPRNTSLCVELRGETLVSGELHGEVRAADLEWVLTDKDGGATRALTITLPKACGPPPARPPLWTALLKGHPEVDVSHLETEHFQATERVAMEAAVSRLAATALGAPANSASALEELTGAVQDEMGR